MSNVKGGAIGLYQRVRIGGAGSRRNIKVRPRLHFAAANSTVQFSDLSWKWWW